VLLKYCGPGKCQGGTMEGPKVLSEARRLEAPKRRGGSGKGPHSPSPVWGFGVYARKKKFFN